MNWRRSLIQGGLIGVGVSSIGVAFEWPFRANFGLILLLVLLFVEFDR